MPSLAQAKEALGIYEARGDTVKANRIREAIQKAEGSRGYDVEQIKADAQQKLNALRASRTYAPEETGIFEDFTTGFGRGFVGVGESAALGLAALAEEETETQLRDRIKSVADSFEPEGGDPESFTSGLGSAFGSIAGIALPAAGVAFGAAPLGASAALASGLATGTAGILGVGAAAGEASERAREAGVSEEVRSAAALRGAPIGFLDVLPMARFVKSIDVPILSKLVDKLGPEQVNTIGEKVRSAALTGGYEAGQEVAAEALQNLNERQYNEAVEIFAGAGEAATFGGIAGGVLDLFLGRRARGIKDKDESFGPPSPTEQEEMFTTGEGPINVPVIRDRLFEGLDTDTFEGVENLPDEQQLEFADRERLLSRAEIDAVKKFNFLKEAAEKEAAEKEEAAGAAPDQASLPGMLPTVQLTDEEVDARLAGVSEEQLADAIAPVGTQLELGEVPRAETTDLLEDTLDVAEVRERVFKGFSASARSKPLNELTAKQQQTVAKRAQALAPVELAALEKLLAQEAAARPTTEVQKSLPGLESEKVGPQLQGLPAPESEAIAGETVAITSEGEALTGEQLLERRQQQATERAEQDAERVTQEAVIGDMPEAEVRMGRERAAIAEREQPDLFPTELAIAEEVATEPEVVPAAEPLRVTSQTLDSLAVPASAPIRQEIPEGALLDDPAVSPRTGNPLPITVRERLVTYGRNRGSRALQTNIDNLLQGEPDGVSTKQRVLPTATQRKPVTARSRTSDEVNLPSLGDGTVSENTVAIDAPVAGAVGSVGSGVGGTTTGTGTESASLVNAPPVVESSSQLVLRPDGTPLTPVVDQDALIQELRTLALTPDSERTSEQRARIAELAKEPEPSTQARTATKSQARTATKSQARTATKSQEEFALDDAEIEAMIAEDVDAAETPETAARNKVFEGFENKRVSQLSVQEQNIVTERMNALEPAERAALEKELTLESGDPGTRTASRKREEGISQNERPKAIRDFHDDQVAEAEEFGDEVIPTLAESSQLFTEIEQNSTRGEIKESTRDKYLMKVSDMAVDPKMAALMNASPTYGLFGSNNVIEAIDTPLESSVVDALNAGDVKGALEALAKTTPDRRARRVAKKLIEYVGTTKVIVVDTTQNDPTKMSAIQARSLSKLFAKEKDGMLPAGLYVGADNVILLNQEGGVNAYTLLHEMAHAATLLEIKTNPQSATVKLLNKLYEDVKATYGDDKPYGAENLAEFVAEAYSNPEFQRELARINSKGGELSSWQKFKEIIAKFFGFDKFGGTAQAEANRLIDNILAPGVAMRGLPNVPTYSTQDGVRKVNDNLAASRSNLTEKQGRASIIRDFMAVFTPDQNPYLKGVMRKTLGILPNQPVFDDIAGKLNIEGATELGDAIKEQRDLLTKSEDVVRKALDPIVRWSTTASKNTMKAFNNLVYSSTIDEVDPELTLDEATKKYGRQTVDGTDQLKIDRYKELHKEYTSSTLGAEGRQAYKNLRKIYADISKDMIASLEGRIDGLNVDEGVKTSLKNQMLARMLAASNVEPYFPLTRKGKHWLAVRNPKDLENPAYITYENLGERNYALKEFESMGYEVETYDPNKLRKSLERKDAPSSAFMGQILSILKDTSIPTATQEQIAQLYIEAMPETTFSKSLIRRKKSLGYDMDAIEAARSKAYDMARQAARLRGSNKIDAVANAVRELFYAVELDAKGEPKNPKKFVRSDLQNDRAEAVLEEMMDRAGFAVSPPADNIAKNLNRGAFIYTIGFNASSALVNLSQIPLFAYPMLAGEYGYSETSAALGSATKLFGGSYMPHAKQDLFGNDIDSNKITDKYTIPSLDNYFTYKKVAGKGGEDTYQYSIRKDIKLPKDPKAAKAFKDELELILPMVQLAAKRGELNTSFLAETLSVDQSGRAVSMIDKITNASAIMFHSAEVMNRQVTMIAAYKLELNKLAGKNTPTAEQKQQAAEEALYRTQQINGGATLETGPRYAREGLGRIALMYKGYGIQMYYTMLKTGKQVVDNAFPGDNAESRELRNQAFKQLAGIHLSAVFFAGIQGVPLYGLVSMLYDMFQEDYEENADEALRSYLDNDALFKGVLSEATGLDVSQRVQLTDLLVEADKFNSDPSPEETLGHYFGGPAWSVTSRAIDGFNEIMDGEIERGIESMMPGAVRNGYKALIRYPRDEGILTRRGDVIYDDLTNGDIITQLLGFPPTAYTRAIGETSAAKGMEDAARNKRSKLLKRYYIAMRFGDYDEADFVLDKIGEFNEEEIINVDPKLLITGDTIDRSMRRHLTTETKMHNGVLLSPYMKAAVEDVGFL